MKTINRKFGPLVVTLAMLAFVACFDIISGTFVITFFLEEPQAISTDEGFYYYFVDLTTDETWQDHEEDIENIDIVGFELWIRNLTPSATTFDVWIDYGSEDTLDTPAAIEANAVRVLDGLPLSAGSNFISYGTSLGHIGNVVDMKAIVETGRLHYYGFSSGGAAAGTDYVVDSGKVVVTLTASGS